MRNSTVLAAIFGALAAVLQLWPKGTFLDAPVSKYADFKQDNAGNITTNVNESVYTFRFVLTAVAIAASVLIVIASPMPAASKGYRRTYRA